MFESFLGILKHNNKRLCVVPTFTIPGMESTLQILGIDGTFLTGHISGHSALLVVVYEGSNNQNLIIIIKFYSTL